MNYGFRALALGPGAPAGALSRLGNGRLRRPQREGRRCLDARIPLHGGTHQWPHGVRLLAFVFFSDRSGRDDETNRAAER